MSRAARHWHVTLTFSGEPVELLLVRASMTRLAEERPFLQSVTCTEATAEVQFWDQGDSLIDVASMALRLWPEHRASAGLPPWQVVGLEVVRKDIEEERAGAGRLAPRQPSHLLPSKPRSGR